MLIKCLTKCLTISVALYRRKRAHARRTLYGDRHWAGGSKKPLSIRQQGTRDHTGCIVDHSDGHVTIECRLLLERVDVLNDDNRCCLCSRVEVRVRGLEAVVKHYRKFGCRHIEDRRFDKHTAAKRQSRLKTRRLPPQLRLTILAPALHATRNALCQFLLVGLKPASRRRKSTDSARSQTAGVHAL